MPRSLQICLAGHLSTTSIIYNSIPLPQRHKNSHNVPAINMAYQTAIIIACYNQYLNLTNAKMTNVICSAVIRDSRKRDHSVVAPTVMIDAPARSRKGSHRSARREEQQTRLRDHEFRYFLDRQGRQHFNFRQRIWLDASVQMAYTRVYSVALKTLAVNLLMRVTPKRDCHAARLTSRQAVLMAPSFIRECLLGAPDEAWALPRTTIEAWLQSRLRARAEPRYRRRGA
jgi:hypothetical protein